MIPGVYNMFIYRGDTVSITLNFEKNFAPFAVPATTWAAKLQTKTVTIPFDVDASQAAAGKITVSLTALASAALPIGEAIWDLQLTVGSYVETYARGAVKVQLGVT